MYYFTYLLHFYATFFPYKVIPGCCKEDLGSLKEDDVCGNAHNALLKPFSSLQFGTNDIHKIRFAEIGILRRIEIMSCFFFFFLLMSYYEKYGQLACILPSPFWYESHKINNGPMKFVKAFDQSP